jgi:hypothetical protein
VTEALVDLKCLSDITRTLIMDIVVGQIQMGDDLG